VLNGESLASFMIFNDPPITNIRPFFRILLAFTLVYGAKKWMGKGREIYGQFCTFRCGVGIWKLSTKPIKF